MISSIGRRSFLTTLGGAAASAPLWPLAANAQQPAQVRRIGVLMPESEDTPERQARVGTFEATLTGLGWTPGRNLQIEYRWARGDPERSSAAATELAALAPDVLVAVATPSLAAIQKATRAIPVVFVGVSEPVANGFVASLAHPGGNVTGFSNLEPSFGAKWLTLLREIAPGVSRVAVVFNPATAPLANAERFFRSVQAVGAEISVTTQMALVHSQDEIETAMMQLSQQPGCGLIFPPDPFTLQTSKFIVAQADRYRLPAIYAFRPFPAIGGLASYGVYVPDLFRLAAGYVDRILKGEKPANLPVQQPTKFQLVINLKTTKALGLTVPQTLLVAADEVIE